MMRQFLATLALLALTACSSASSNAELPSGDAVVTGGGQATDEVPPPHPPQEDCTAPTSAADIAFAPSLAVEAILAPDRAERLEGDVRATPLGEPSVLWGDSESVPSRVYTTGWSLPEGRYVLLLRTDGQDVYYPAGGPVGLYRVGEDQLLYMQCPAYPSGEKLREAPTGLSRDDLVTLLR